MVPEESALMGVPVYAFGLSLLGWLRARLPIPCICKPAESSAEARAYQKECSWK